MNIPRCLKMMASFLLLFSVAHATPDTFVYEGVLQDSNGPIGVNTQLVLRIYNPDLSCLLYEEVQAVTPSADGSFSVLVGSAVGSSKRTSNDAGLEMKKVFLASGAVRSSGASFCANGYTAAAGEGRRLMLNINGVDMLPTIEISAAPFAISSQNSQAVGGYEATKLLRSEGSATVPALTDNNVNFLMSLLSGTLANPSASGEVANKGYVDGVTSTLLSSSVNFSGDVSGTYSTLQVDKIQGKVIDTTNIAANKILKYDGSKWVMANDETGAAPNLSDGKIWIGNSSNGPSQVTLAGDATIDNAGNLSLSTVGTVTTKGQADKIPQITTDAKGRVTALSEVAVNDSTKLPLTGGALSGNLNMSGFQITNVSNVPHVDATPTLAEDGKSLRWDHANSKWQWFTAGISGAGITSFNGSTNTIQSFATPGTSGNAPNWSTDVGTGEHTLNIPMASTASVAAGLLSHTDYTSMMSKQGSALATGSIWVGNASGGAEARSLGGDISSVSGTGEVVVVKTTTGEINKLLSLNGSGVGSMKGLELLGGSSGSVAIQTPTSFTSYSLTLPADDGVSGQVLQTDGNGILSWGDRLSAVSNIVPLTSQNIWVGDVNGKAQSVQISGDATLSNTGVLTVNKTITAEASKLLQLDASSIAATKGVKIGGAGAGAATLKYPSTTNSVVLTLPDVVGTPGQVLQTDGAGVLSWITVSGGGGGTISIGDIQGSQGAQIPTTCSVSQTMIWNSLMDRFECAEIRQSNAATFSTAAQTVYVSSSGDDVNCNGSSITIGSYPDCPFQTLQKAVDSLPAIIRHPVSINLLTGLTATAGNSVMARIDKTVAAQSLTGGPLLTIQGDSNSVKVLNGANYSEVSGIVVSAAARGVYIKNIDFTNFTDTALRVEGGLAVLENSNINNSKSSLSVEDGGRLMLDGNIYIYLLSTGGVDNSTGIRVNQASLISEAGLNIDIGYGQNNRGIAIEHGSVSLESNASVYTSYGTANYLSAVDIGTAGSLNISEGMALNITMNLSSANMTAVNIRSGNLSVGQGGILRLSSIGGRGLICENSSSCQFYGNLEVNTSSTSNPVSIRGNSIFNSQGDITFAGNPTNPGAYFEVTDNSTVMIAPYGAAQLNINNGGNTMAVFRLKNGAQVLMEPTNTYNLNSINGTFSSFFEASSLSSVKANAGGTVSGTNYTTLQNLADESSRINISGNFSFKSPTRICPAGTTAIGNGPRAFCIDSAAPGSLAYFAAISACSERGYKLCSVEQYALYCKAGNAVANSWVDYEKTIGCNGTNTMSPGVMTYTGTTPYRCCQ